MNEEPLTLAHRIGADLETLDKLWSRLAAAETPSESTSRRLVETRQKQQGLHRPGDPQEPLVVVRESLASEWRGAAGRHPETAGPAHDPDAANRASRAAIFASASAARCSACSARSSLDSSDVGSSRPWRSKSRTQVSVSPS